MNLTTEDIARMIDFSAVTGGVGDAEVEEVARGARRHGFICAIVPQCHVRKLRGLLEGHTGTLVGTVVGFPSGASTTEAKVFESKLALEHGCDELDMVINVGALRSGDYGFVKNDIRAVVEAAGGRTVKAILEVHFLTDDQIKKGCELCIGAGAHFVKTATGWFPTGATPRNVALIKSCVGDSIRIKASGGIRSLDTLIELYKLGAARFGISAQSALKIIQECEALPGGVAV
jgi:deoxyribose-phosphate aldolase